MRSVSLTVSGSFWDSQIYSGELILFDCDGALNRIDWNAVIDGLAVKNSPVQTALRVAFSDSDLFYNPKVRKILCDPAIESPIKLQLASLAELQMAGSNAEWRANWRTEDTPFDFLSTDTDIYYNRIFACGDEGLFSSPRNNVNAGRLFKKTAAKHHDAGMLQIKASDRFTAVAAAAGGDGLFEFSFNRSESDVLNKHRQLASRPCSACDWAFQSVMGWTVENAFLANFRQERDVQTNKQVRSFDRIVESSEMFGNSPESDSVSFTWGSREKIYRFSEKGIEVTNYSPAQSKKVKMGVKPISESFAIQGHEKFQDKNSFSGQPIATGVAPFGTILEFDDQVIVLRSDGKIEKFLGEPVHWRVFPRSEHYSNHLHIIYEDHVKVISFVHDYFVNQSSKLYGFSRGAGSLVDDEE